MQLQTGQTISHYRIAGTLGRSGMGEVYIAEDIKLSRRVALKILPADLAADADRRVMGGNEDMNGGQNSVRR